MIKYLNDKNALPEWQAKPYRIGKVASGRTVLVTGATSAAGRKACRKLIDQGDRLIVLARDKAKAADIFGPHAMIISSRDVISQGTAIDQVINFSKTHSKRRKSSSTLVSWAAPFLS